MRKPEQKRESKWDKKAEMGILIGYSNVGYRVILNNRVIVAKHVDILEEGVKCIGLGGNESRKENELKTEKDENSDNESLTETFESMNETIEGIEMLKEPEVSRLERTRNLQRNLMIIMCITVKLL